MIYLRNFKKDLLSHTLFKKIDIVAVRHNLKYLWTTEMLFFFCFKGEIKKWFLFLKVK